MPDNQRFSSKAAASKAADSRARKASTLYKNLQDITRSEITGTKRSVVMPLVRNVAWQLVVLDESRAELMGESIYMPYDNGGGQIGIREHPGFTAYNKLFATASRGIKQITDLLPDESAAADELASYLDQTRAR